MRLKSDEYIFTDLALENLLKKDTFQSSIIIQITSNYHFQTFPATTGNFLANGHLVRKSDVDDDEDDVMDNDDHACNVDDRTNDVNIE